MVGDLSPPGQSGQPLQGTPISNADPSGRDNGPIIIGGIIVTGSVIDHAVTLGSPGDKAAAAGDFTIGAVAALATGGVAAELGVESVSAELGAVNLGTRRRPPIWPGDR
jgi:hypothetical protein